MKPVLVFLFLGLGLMAGAQGSFARIDWKEIQKAVQHEGSSTAYATLLDRYNAFDPSLGREEYRLLYFGSVFQNENYALDRKKDINQAMGEKNYPRALAICDTLLQMNPVSLGGNYYKGLALYLSDTSKLDFKKYRDRFVHLVDAILSSGNGLTCGTGYTILTVSDEYTMIYLVLGIKQFMGQSLVDKCDVLKVKPSDEWPHEEIFFDASEILKKEAELFGK
jgi:Domain of unknown function (DUF4919)